ncbi:PTS sugar transporter subunit IIA [bacterium]|nr:PTS sugar transporter subunit IIA [bacterium]
MYLYELLDKDSILISLESVTKDDVLEEMVNVLDSAGKIKNRDTVLKAIVDRERIMTTGIGNGVAVPHCKTSAVDHLVAALGISREGIDFQSPDNQPAHLIFILVAEENNPGPHVRALARLAKLLSSKGVRDALLAARSPEDLLQTIKDKEQGF